MWIAKGKEQQKGFILSKNSIDMVALMLACMRMESDRMSGKLASFSQRTGSAFKKTMIM